MTSDFQIHHCLFIDASPEKVFDAVTQPKHLNNWWTLTCEGRPAAGNKYNFYFGDEYNWFGKVSKCKANEQFFIAMTQSSLGWETTTFGFELKPHKRGTTVYFSHVGWQQQDEHFKITSFCWAMLLNGLKQYMEKGIIIPFNERS